MSRAPARQRGWVGIIVLLIALVIVAVLAQKALKSYGLLPAADTPVRAGGRVPGPAAPAESDTAAAPAAPMTAIERARGVEKQLQRDAQDQAQRIDEQTK